MGEVTKWAKQDLLWWSQYNGGGIIHNHYFVLYSLIRYHWHTYQNMSKMSLSDKEITSLVTDKLLYSWSLRDNINNYLFTHKTLKRALVNMKEWS